MAKKATCGQCGHCCSYITIHIDEPEDKEDWEAIRWYVLHENITVFIDNEGDWLVEFKTRCKEMKENMDCGIYNERPDVCRGHDPDNCENNAEGNHFQIIFRNEKDVKDYMRLKNIK
jgi:uncharacterized protein